jgi:toxin ParE1/3/4
MSRILDVTARAKSDLGEIFGHISGDNPGAAARFTTAAEECFILLLQNPFLGRERSVRSPTLWGLRCFGIPGYRNFLVYYTVDENAVVIIRVLHGARDADAALEGAE